MPVDPRLNCASEVCCSPSSALRAATSILLDAGCPDEYAALCARNLHEMGITFTSLGLAHAIAEIADHPGRRGAWRFEGGVVPVDVTELDHDLE